MRQTFPQAAVYWHKERLVNDIALYAAVDK